MTAPATRPSTIVFAFDGSPSSTAAITWMIDTWRLEVVTLTLDLGQRDELDAVRERALSAGATRAHVLDVRESFAHDYLIPALRAGAACDEGRPLGRQLSRALIARQLVDVARMESTSRVAHGAWRDPNDRACIEQAIRDLGPELDLRAPLADWGATDEEMAAFAAARGVRPPSFRVRTSQADLWGRCLLESSVAQGGPAHAGTAQGGPAQGSSAQGGVASGATGSGAVESGGSQSAIYTLTKSPAATPATPAFVELAFEHGVPVGINGVTMPLLEIISSLETIAGAHGVGRSTGLETVGDDRLIIQRAYVCESPAATVLDEAHRWLERMVLPDDLRVTHEQVRATYLDLVRRGGFGSLTRAACQAFIDRTQDGVSGSVRVKLSHGACQVVGVAPHDAPAPSSSSDRRPQAAGSRA